MGLRDSLSEDICEKIGQAAARILFVDDEPLVLDCASLILEMEGFAVTCARSAEEGLQTFEASPYAFDLVVSDQTMPTLSGSALAAKLRELRSDIPIVIISGWHDYDAPMTVCDFLPKPFSAEQLVGCVTKILWNRKVMGKSGADIRNAA